MLNPIQIFKHSSKLTIAGMIGAALNFPVSVIVANKLGPSTWGQVSFVLLWVTYAGLLHIGMLEGGQREIIHALSLQKPERARFFQNLSLTGELGFSLLPAATLLGAAWFFPDPVRKVGFILAPLAFLGTTVSRTLASYHFAHQRFGFYARLNLVRSVSQTLLVLALVFIIGPYGLFVAPVLVEWGICVLFLTFAPALSLRWEFDISQASRLVAAGLPLGLQALVYWAYRLTGLTSVAIWLPNQQLGYYAFSAKLIDLAVRPFSDFGSVLMPTLWSEIGRAAKPNELGPDAIRILMLMTIATCAVSNLFQAGFAPLVNLVAPKFVPSVPIFEILSFNIILLTIISVPSLVLDSVVVNKQWLHLNIWIGGLIVNLAANYFVLRKEWGLIGVAWNDIWVQLIVIAVIYASTHQYLFGRNLPAWRFYFAEVILLALCGAVFISLRWIPISFGGLGSLGVAVTIGARLLIVLVVWLVVGLVFYCCNRRSSFRTALATAGDSPA
jgi:O-antigen/teichoic acid export membrane protein